MRTRDGRTVLAASLAVAGFVLSLTACSSGSDAGGASVTVSPSTTADFAGTVDIGGGRRMYLECRGSGSPTVVLVSGLDTAADLWDIPDQPDPKVLPSVADSTRVCAYDRPGAPRAVGGPSRSDPVPQPTSPQSAVADLHALLTAAHVPGPYVLAGHSYGGIVSRLYAATYPDEVSGMVFVDIVSPELRADMTPAQWAIWKVLNARKAEDVAAYPELEQIEFDPALDQIVAGGPIRAMPLVVLSADKQYGPDLEAQAAKGELPKGVPADFGYVIDRANKEAQAQLAQLVPGAEHITKTHSGHNMMIDNAPLVIHAIDDVLAAVRAGRTSMLTADTPASIPPEGLVDIGGGRQLYLHCRGTGSPTVVLVSGTQGAYDEWTHVFDDVEAPPVPSDHAVLPEVSRFTRVCGYDRPGTTRFTGELSPSTPVAQPTTAEQGVSDLHALLTAAGIPGPYVVVGGSWGGMITKLFASTYPDQTAGLVFVDGATELVKESFTAKQWSGWMAKIVEGMKAGAPGLETPAYDPSVDELVAAPAVPAVPAVVLTAQKPWDLQVGDGSTWPKWLESQDLLATVLHARHISKTHSGHAIAVEKPALVVGAIRDVVDEARNSAP